MQLTELSDEVQIGEKTWKSLKADAMANNNHFQSWFIRLNVLHKRLVNRLIEAQTAQGNMEKLTDFRFNKIEKSEGKQKRDKRKLSSLSTIQSQLNKDENINNDLI